MFYSLEHPNKEIIADFYYVALKTRISGSKLINELKSDVNMVLSMSCSSERKRSVAPSAFKRRRRPPHDRPRAI